MKSGKECVLGMAFLVPPFHTNALCPCLSLLATPRGLERLLPFFPSFFFPLVLVCKQNRFQKKNNRFLPLSHWAAAATFFR